MEGRYKVDMLRSSVHESCRKTRLEFKIMASSMTGSVDGQHLEAG